MGERQWHARGTYGVQLRNYHNRGSRAIAVCSGSATIWEEGGIFELVFCFRVSGRELVGNPHQYWSMNDLIRRQPLLLSVCLLAAVLWTFWPATDNGFVGYDDPVYVTGNGHVQQGLSLKN